MSNNDRTRRSFLHCCGLGVAVLGGCTSRKGNEKLQKAALTETTESEAKTSTNRGTSVNTETETGKTTSAGTHSILLAVNNYDTEDKQVSVTVTKEGASTEWNRDITVPAKKYVTFEDALTSPKGGSVSYEISVAIRGGTTTSKTYRVESGHDLHAVVVKVLGENEVEWASNGH